MRTREMRWGWSWRCRKKRRTRAWKMCIELEIIFQFAFIDSRLSIEQIAMYSTLAEYTRWTIVSRKIFLRLFIFFSSHFRFSSHYAIIGPMMDLLDNIEITFAKKTRLGTIFHAVDREFWVLHPKHLRPQFHDRKCVDQCSIRWI